MEDIHIGKAIRKRLQEIGMSKTEFARRINRTSQNVYDIFERKSMDSSLLLEISVILKDNLFDPYSEAYGNKMQSGDFNELNEETAPYLSSGELKKALFLCKKEKEKLNDETLRLSQEVGYLKEINSLLKGEG